MAGSFFHSLDAQLDIFFAGWNTTSTFLAAASVAVLFYPLFFGQSPDAHPFLLARQAHASPVRRPGESAVYRAPETPHGFPLRTGLNVRDPAAPAWQPGKDGDLRHVWRAAVEGKGEGQVATVWSVKGRDRPVPNKPRELTVLINVFGAHVRKIGGSRVAIYLPNSVEFLVALFACSFYGFPAILIPQGQTPERLAALLRETRADVLVAPAGAVPQDLHTKAPGLGHTIWVVEETSRQVEWLAVADPRRGAEWHDVVEELRDSVGAEVPAIDAQSVAPNVITVWQGSGEDDAEIVTFTQKNLIAATAAQLHALPPAHRLEPRDLLLALTPLTAPHTLTLHLAALFAGASLALTSAASGSPGSSGGAPDYALASAAVAPTVVLISAASAAQLHARQRAAAGGLFATLDRSRQARQLAAGAMPRANALAKDGAGAKGAGPRLLYVAARAGAPPLSSAELADLRIGTGARVVHALAAARVAGAVCQTHCLDYRVAAQGAQPGHFGPPLSCLELRLVQAPGRPIPDDESDGDGAREAPVGELVAAGPAVAGGEANLGVLGAFGADDTLALK